MSDTITGFWKTGQEKPIDDKPDFCLCGKVSEFCKEQKMKRPGLVFLPLLAVWLFGRPVVAAELFPLYEYESEHSGVRFYLDEQNGQKGITAEFVGTDGLHYYASDTTAPAPGAALRLSARAEGISFGPAVFPPPSAFRDEALQQDIDVYAGRFKVFLPALSGLSEATAGEAEITLSGLACTDKLCLMPIRKTFRAVLRPSPGNPGGLPTLEKVVEITAPSPSLPPSTQPSKDDALRQTLAGWKEEVAGQRTEERGRLFYFLLAVPAGLSINLMPCVLPILPLVIMRLVMQAKESAGRRLMLGLAFCGGIVLFFAAFAVLSTLISLTTGLVIDLNFLYRQPSAVIALFLLLVFFSLVFFDVIVFTVPASFSSRQQTLGSGYAGSIAMGFFMGLLSTPCSGALLGAVLVWAQSQPPAVSSPVIILMGIGMALPYALLISIPKLLDFVPKPGVWMELFKKSCGFLLLILAVKFTLTPLSKERLIQVLLYGVIFAFCLWMWGQWVQWDTPAFRRRAIRLLAAAIAIGCGFRLLPAEPPAAVPWQPYDRGLIQRALAEGRPVLIQFTADWCTNCQVVKRKVYQQPDLVKLLKERNILTIQADTTQADFPASADLKTIFGEAGNVPVTVLLEPGSKTMIKIRGIFEPDQLRRQLSQIPSSTLLKKNNLLIG